MKNFLQSARAKALMLWALLLGVLIESATAATNTTVATAVTNVNDTVGVVVTALVTLLATFLGIAFIKRIRRA